MVKRLEGFFGLAMFSDISHVRVEAYQQARIHDVCPASVKRETALLKHTFNLAERWEIRQDQSREGHPW